MFVKRRLLSHTNKIISRTTHTEAWIKPTGHDTNIKVYNCVAKSDVPFIVKDKSLVTWYTCGPTVYDSAHIGHASCYVKLDIIQRILREHFNLNIVSVMNITDIDDKIIKRSVERNVSPQEIANSYEAEFWQDLKNLNVIQPDKIIRVTDNIPVIVDFINQLYSNKQAYSTNDGSVYFDVEAYTNQYGKLQNIRKSSEEEVQYKKSPADFALWKSAKKGEPSWISPFGPGRPGWHIECSALASKLLGSSIDIHAGGIDLRFPHHENEETQSCAYFGKKQWVNYWFHTGHLHLKDSTKMSKSLGNTLSIQDLLKSCKPDTFRMACLLSNYRNNMEFSDDLLYNSERYLLTFKNFATEINLYLSGQSTSNLNNDVLAQNLCDTACEVNEALIDDFNTPQCIKRINNLISLTNKMLHSAAETYNTSEDNSALLIGTLNYVNNILSMFGLNPKAHTIIEQTDNDFTNMMNTLVEFRKELRLLAIRNNDKDVLNLCDSVRDKVKKSGYTLLDRGATSTWTR